MKRKFDNGRDDGKYFAEDRAQFDVTIWSSRAMVDEAIWHETDEPMTDDEIDTLNFYFSDWLDDEWYAQEFGRVCSRRWS